MTDKIQTSKNPTRSGDDKFQKANRIPKKVIIYQLKIKNIYQLKIYNILASRVVIILKFWKTIQEPG